MGRAYTTEQAYKKLGVSQATLYRWLEQAKADGVETEVLPQSGLVDKRERLYTLAQLKWLARRHRVTLLSDEQAFAYEPDQEVRGLRQEVGRLTLLLEEQKAALDHVCAEVEQLRHVVHVLETRAEKAELLFVEHLRWITATLEPLRTESRSAPPPPVSDAPGP